MDMTKRSTPQSFRQRVRDAACERFNTVLGPGSDPYHAEHIHVDLAERAHRYRMRQWDVGDAVAEERLAHARPNLLAYLKASAQPGLSLVAPQLLANDVMPHRLLLLS